MPWRQQLRWLGGAERSHCCEYGRPANKQALRLLVLPPTTKGKVTAREKYPEECAALSDPETGDWEHGFNSGCLAVLRLALSALNPTTVIDPAYDGEGLPCQLDGLQIGLEEFPFLDT